MTASPPPSALRIGGAVVASLLAAGLLLTVFALGWVAIRGAIAADLLRSAQGTAQQVVADIDDPAAASTGIDEVADDVAMARGLTSDPLWRLVEIAPWLGPQLKAVSTVAAAADDVARDALRPLAEVASTLSPDSFRPADGHVELSSFVAMQDTTSTAGETVASATASLDRINTTALVGPLRRAVDQVKEVFAGARAGTATLANASTLLPAMLGADGPRNYLLLFQNNAEWRSLGGINGAMVQIHTDAGSMELVATDAGNNFARSEASVLPLSDEITAIYGQRPGQWMQNVTQIPDFAETGALAREFWALRHGVDVDGVIAIDPVALSYILRATGPVPLPSGDVLTADNAVALLLNEVYLRYEDTKMQDAFFADATTAVFATLTRGAADPSVLLDSLAQAGTERRLLMWSAHTEDQAVLAPTTLAGGLPVTDSKTTTFGVFVNDGTGSKMDFYQTLDTTVEWVSCTMDAAGTAQGTAVLTATVASNAPPDAARLPDYITAAGWFGVPPGITRTVGYIYVPEGFELVDTSLSNGGGFAGGFHDGRRVLSFDVLLAPGESVTATVIAASTSPTGAELVAQATPTVDANVTRRISTCL